MVFGKNSIYVGSGSLIGDQYVLTAAHNLCMKKDGTDQSISPLYVIFSPGKNGFTTPKLGEFYSTTFFWHAQYETLKDPLDARNFDIGLFVLRKDDKPLPQQHLKLKTLSDNMRMNSINVTGYPGEKKDFMFTMNGPLIEIEEHILRYDIDTTAGQSGSGVWWRDESDGKEYIIGVHTNAPTLLEKDLNIGTRLTLAKQDTLNKWIDIFNVNDNKKIEEKKEN